MSKKTISVRVTQRTYEEFEEYRHDQGTETEPLSKADAGRELIESGLENEKRPDTVAPQRTTAPDARDNDDPQPRGPLTVLMSLAGNDLRSQFDALGLWVAFTGLFVYFSTTLPLGPVWLVPAAVLGFASLSTLILGIGVGLVDQLDPDPAEPADSASSADEVEQ